jgi:5-bromo-4-chloroindolyl phosphate hydrolysis protein
MNFQFEALGPTLRIVVLVFLLIFALLILGFIVFIAILPGKIAKARSHP